MRPPARSAGLALLVGSLVALLAGIPAGLARSGGATHAAPPVTGWVVDRVRFEPLGGTGSLAASGLGSYRGSLELRPSVTAGQLAAINQVGLDDYLRGLAEVPPTWPMEALKAQVVAARTYALHEMVTPGATEARSVGADLCATDACQVYAGMAREAETGAVAWDAAVAATSGQVMEYQGAPILAMYSSSNGGRSVDGGLPYLRSVPDPDDATSPLHHWTITLPLASLARDFATPGPVQSVTSAPGQVLLNWASGGTATGSSSAQSSPAPIGPAQTGPAQASPTPTTTPSGPLPGPTTTTTAPQAPTTTTTAPTEGPPASPPGGAAPASSGTLTLSPQAFRDGLNADEAPPAGLPLTVPSDRFTVSTNQPAQAAVIDGGGWGHGIGMSQYGALGKALRGMKAPDILAAYYGGLRPVTLPPTQLPPTLRVALSTAVATTTVSAPGPFRVLDGAGHVLAVSATGEWTVSPGPSPSQVRIVPPGDQSGPPAVSGARVVPDHPAAGAPVTVQFSVAPGAQVGLTSRDPDGTTSSVDGGLAQGQVTETLHAGNTPGTYAVTVVADAGGGRVTSVPLVFTVADATGVGPVRAAMGPAGAGPTRLPHPRSGWVGLALLAALCLAAVVAGSAKLGVFQAAWAGRPGRRPLH